MRIASRFTSMPFVLLALAGCNVSMGSFTVPAQVWAGHVFEVVVSANCDGQSGSVGAVLQLPNGFTVEGAVAVGHGSGLVVVPGGGQGAPGPIPAAEPGHYTAGFSGSHVLGLGTSSTAWLRVFVRAPALPGAFVLKVVVVGTNGVQPAGTTTFATITAAPHAQPLAVVGSPVTPFVPEPNVLGALAGSAIGEMVHGDVDRDGLVDLVCVVAQPPGLQVWLNRPGSAWQPLHPPAGAPGASYLHVALGDLDGDGNLDLADNTGRVLFGDGGISWTPGPTLPLLIPDFAGVGIGDVDGDGRGDVALTARSTDAVQVFHSEPNRTFSNWTGSLPNGTNGPAGADRAELADVSGDGICDLVAGGTIGLRAWTGDGQGHWQPASTGLPVAGVFALGDVDQNGQIDVFAAVSPGVAVFTFSNGAWVPRPMPMTAMSPPSSLLVLDQDRDGWSDVLATIDGYPFPGLGLLGNVAGQSFAAPVSLTAMLAPYSGRIASIDTDGDTWPDFVAAFPGEAPVVWQNTGSGFSPFGRACSGPGFAAPRTASIGTMQLGTTATIELSSAAANALGLIWLGVSNRYAFGAPVLPWSLAPLGAPGCAVFASTEAPFFVVCDATGRASVPLAIPNDPSLRRVTLFAQSAAQAPGANALGWLFANGLALKIP